MGRPSWPELLASISQNQQKLIGRLHVRRLYTRCEQQTPIAKVHTALI